MNQNPPAAITPVSTPTPQHAQSLSQDQLDAHRQQIAFDVEVILDGYWDKRPPEHVKAGIMADWADSLEDWTPEQILFALRKWRGENPSKKPNPGHITAILKDMRGRAEVNRRPPPQIEPPKERVTGDAAKRIMDEIGFNPKRFGGAS
ncbi:MAG: hypothetical protein ACPG4X_21515 [Pikeienuella sp.]